MGVASALYTELLCILFSNSITSRTNKREKKRECVEVMGGRADGEGNQVSIMGWQQEDEHHASSFTHSSM